MSEWKQQPSGLFTRADEPKPAPVEPATLDACPQCSAAFVKIGDISETCVGYYSPEGHDHDDNCLSASATCENGHRTRFSVQRSCPACDWRGKSSCCNGDMPAKLRQWPTGAVEVECRECDWRTWRIIRGGELPRCSMLIPSDDEWLRCARVMVPANPSAATPPTDTVTR